MTAPQPDTASDPTAARAMSVTVVAPDRVLLSGPAVRVTVPSVAGSLGVLPRHEPVAALLAAGAVRVVPADGPEVELQITGGFVVVDDDQVTVLVDATRTDG
ncbi:ATP synthase F1 subunit epsilon [Cellulomonas sp. Y8]|uniref:ATP synthase F1 subunit epsilon n=1 Tax=Cellulomonas sp. Y8 TaxID=2591145 RepID=UPI003D711C7E